MNERLQQLCAMWALLNESKKAGHKVDAELNAVIKDALKEVEVIAEKKERREYKSYGVHEGEIIRGRVWLGDPRDGNAQRLDASDNPLLANEIRVGGATE